MSEAINEILKDKAPYFGPVLDADQCGDIVPRYFPKIVETARRGDEIKLLEVGTWCGASLFNWIAAIDEAGIKKSFIGCIDNWSTSSEAYAMFRNNLRKSGYDSRVNVTKGNSRTLMPCLMGDYYDIVYLDGATDYETAIHDVTHGARIVRPGGILCGVRMDSQSGIAQAVRETLSLVERTDSGFWATKSCGGGEWVAIGLEQREPS